MNIKHLILPFFLLLSLSIFSQEITEKNASLKPEIKLTYLDSIKKTFVKDDLASCVDSLWLKELTNLDIYNNLTEDIQTINIDEKVDYELPTELLKTRLQEMDEKSPFHIEYNQGLENIIKSFLKNRKRSFEDIDKARKFALEKFSGELLSVKDSLDAALTIENANVDSYKNGVELTQKQLINVFEKFGIHEIKALGEKFDPNQHQAISMVESEEEPNKILTVLQKGYLLNERVIRPALVTVSKTKNT